MSETVSIEHDFECSEKGFWEVFMNNDYNREMFLTRLGFARWDVLQFDKTDTTLDRTIEVEPDVGNLPGPIKKVIGERISYREQGRLDLTKHRYELKVIPPTLADKISVVGAQYTRPLGEGRCKRIFEATITVKIFGVGGLIEKRIAADMYKSYDIGADFTAKYVAQHGIV